VELSPGHPGGPGDAEGIRIGQGREKEVVHHDDLGKSMGKWGVLVGLVGENP